MRPTDPPTPEDTTGSVGGTGAGSPVAFVLGGGGVLGAVEVGMLQALLEAGITPDMILGTSVGALNGAVVAADPSLAATQELVDLWTSNAVRDVYRDPLVRQAGRFATRSHLLSPDPLRELITRTLGDVTRFEDLAVPFRCCAASIERAAEHWFSEGPLVDAILASSAVPGLLPPVEIDGEHFIDGGIVNSIPVSAAITGGARTVYVLQVGRIERPLAVPRTPRQVALVAFEVARRHRFAHDVANLPPGVDLHVLPTGARIDQPDRFWHVPEPPEIRDRIHRAYEASREYLAAQGG